MRRVLLILLLALPGLPARADEVVTSCAIDGSNPIASIGGPVAAAIAWNDPRASWMDGLLLKPPPFRGIALDDLTNGPPPVRVAIPPMTPADDAATRYTKISAFPIADLVAGPGYRFYRQPEIFASVRASILGADGKCNAGSAIFNVHTDAAGNVQGVDLESHHVALAACLDAGKATMADLEPGTVTILVNGMTAYGSPQRQGVHAYPIALDNFGAGHEILAPASPPGAIWTDAARTNFDMGSRNSMGRFHETLVHRTAPKIGVAWLDYSKPIDGPLATIRAAIAAQSLDQVVIAPMLEGGMPAENPVLPADAVAKIQADPTLNLYVGDAFGWARQFGAENYAEMLRQQMCQVYGTGVAGIVNL
jgi:hypothetical protein